MTSCKHKQEWAYKTLVVAVTMLGRCGLLIAVNSLLTSRLYDSDRRLIGMAGRELIDTMGMRFNCLSRRVEAFCSGGAISLGSPRAMVFSCAVAILTILVSFASYPASVAAGVPAIASVSTFDVAVLLDTIAKSVQLLGLLAGISMFFSANSQWNKKRSYALIQMTYAGIISGACFLTPELAKWGIPTLLGVNPF